MLFELANEDRLKILSFLERSPLHSKDIARKLSVTDPEASRHLSRLGKAGFVAKGRDGAYSLTPFGRLSAAVLPTFEVIASRKDLFLSHDLSRLPIEFLRRIGALAENQYLNHIDEALGFVDEVTKGAEEYVWIMTDRPVRLEHHNPDPKALSVRIVCPHTFDKEIVSLLKLNWPGAKSEVGHLKTPPPVTIVLNERRSGVFFYSPDGQVDLSSGLAGESICFREWCQDLVDYFWKRARK